MVELGQTRVHVAASQTRCPYCHDQVQVDEPHQVCSVCLARHHDDCWTNHGACSNCAHSLALVPSKQGPVETSTITDLELRPLLGSRIDCQVEANAMQISWAQNTMSQREKLLLVCFLFAFFGEILVIALGSIQLMVTLFFSVVMILIFMLMESSVGLKALLTLGLDGVTYATPGQARPDSVSWDELETVTLKVASPKVGERHPHGTLALNGLILKKRLGELRVGTSLNAIEAEWLKGEIQRARDYFKKNQKHKKS
ncbi:MAG: hypothetical protein P1V97_16800 [Planctomycetota bacterium]|nr:hypothetical protein [Planctomycetota bacterium]